MAAPTEGCPAGLEPPGLEGVAGHDDASVAHSAPEVAMLLARCEDGIGHNPAESVCEEDVAVALGVLVRGSSQARRVGGS